MASQNSTRSIIIVGVVIAFSLLAFLSFFGVMACVLGRRKKRMEKVRKEALEALSARFGGCEVTGSAGGKHRVKSVGRMESVRGVSKGPNGERKWWWEEELEMDKVVTVSTKGSSRPGSSVSEDESGFDSTTVGGSVSGSSTFVDAVTLRLNVEYEAASAYIPSLLNPRDGLEHIQVNEGDVLVVEWKLDDVYCFGFNRSNDKAGIFPISCLKPAFRDVV
ncbi:hypothetical protein HDU67_006502 [Dinochytrium kinnereticum]|nr:hypothetical protein HDU67_006502 [Dinochytrium kinnereticum]